MGNLKRPAIAMIELIFALVIMGIVMMSAPMLISTASKTSTVALQQEGIHEATSRITMILTYDWDEADTNDSCIPPVLSVTSGDGELNETANTSRRSGISIETSSRTFLCSGQEFNATYPLGTEAGDQDDIDDFANNPGLVDINDTGGGQDYLEKTTVSIGTTVAYIDDNASYGGTTITYVPGADVNASTNIKKISVNLTSTSAIDELTKTIKLNAFSCNIGGYEYEKRVMP